MQLRSYERAALERVCDVGRELGLFALVGIVSGYWQRVVVDWEGRQEAWEGLFGRKGPCTCWERPRWCLMTPDRSLCLSTDLCRGHRAPRQVCRPSASCTNEAITSFLALLRLASRSCCARLGMQLLPMHATCPAPLPAAAARRSPAAACVRRCRRLPSAATSNQDRAHTNQQQSWLQRKCTTSSTHSSALAAQRQRQRAAMSGPRGKESALDLAKFVDKSIRFMLGGGRDGVGAPSSPPRRPHAALRLRRRRCGCACSPAVLASCLLQPPFAGLMPAAWQVGKPLACHFRSGGHAEGLPSRAAAQLLTATLHVQTKPCDSSLPLARSGGCAQGLRPAAQPGAGRGGGVPAGCGPFRVVVVVVAPMLLAHQAPAAFAPPPEPAAAAPPPSPCPCLPSPPGTPQLSLSAAAPTHPPPPRYPDAACRSRGSAAGDGPDAAAGPGGVPRNQRDAGEREAQSRKAWLVDCAAFVCCRHGCRSKCAALVCMRHTRSCPVGRRLSAVCQSARLPAPARPLPAPAQVVPTSGTEEIANPFAQEGMEA